MFSFLGELSLERRSLWFPLDIQSLIRNAEKIKRVGISAQHGSHFLGTSVTLCVQVPEPKHMCHMRLI